jgi:hypothetical protein
MSTAGVNPEYFHSVFPMARNRKQIDLCFLLGMFTTLLSTC